MADANEEYRRMLDWGSAVRLGLNSTAIVLQTLVIKAVLTRNEAILLVDGMEDAAAKQTSTSEAQKQVVAATCDQIRTMLRGM